MTPTDETFSISPLSVIASDHWCLEDALNVLIEGKCIDDYSDLTQAQMNELYKRIRKTISLQGYPDAESFHEIVQIAYIGIK